MNIIHPFLLRLRVKINTMEDKKLKILAEGFLVYISMNLVLYSGRLSINNHRFFPNAYHKKFNSSYGPLMTTLF